MRKFEYTETEILEIKKARESSKQEAEKLKRCIRRTCIKEGRFHDVEDGNKETSEPGPEVHPARESVVISR